MTKRKHNSKPDKITPHTKIKKRINKGLVKKMDYEKIVPERKHKMTPVSKSADHGVTSIENPNLGYNKPIVKIPKEPIPVMYGDKAIPPGPYNHEDTLKYMRYALETASSADSQQIEKLLEILHYLLDNTIYQEV